MTPRNRGYTEEIIGQLGLGESLVSTLDKKGVPSIVERTLMAPPRSKIGPIDAAERRKLIDRSPLRVAYSESVDRESAYEILRKRQEETIKKRELQSQEARTEKAEKRSKSGRSRRQGVGEAFAKSVARAVGSSLGRQIIRGILGSIAGGK